MSEEVKLSETLDRFGLNEIPTYRTEVLPVDLLVIEDGQGGGSSRKTMVNNMKTIGVLQNLIVIERGDGTYTVVSGNRRLTNAIEAGITRLECHIYPEETDWKYVHIMRLSENMKRSPNWPGQVASIKDLILSKVGMTHKEIAKILGISITSLSPLFKLAELPMPFIHEMLAHRMPKELALKIASLTNDERNKLLEVIKTGGQITPELVKELRMSQFATNHPDLMEQMPIVPPPAGSNTTESLPQLETPNELDWLEIRDMLERLKQYARTKSDRPGRIVVTLIEQLNSQLDVLKPTEVA